MPSFKYLICLDFEATCWPGKYTNKENAEIIGKFKFLLYISSDLIDKLWLYHTNIYSRKYANQFSQIVSAILRERKKKN